MCPAKWKWPFIVMTHISIWSYSFILFSVDSDQKTFPCFCQIFQTSSIWCLTACLTILCRFWSYKLPGTSIWQKASSFIACCFIFQQQYQLYQVLICLCHTDCRHPQSSFELMWKVSNAFIILHYTSLCAIHGSLWYCGVQPIVKMHSSLVCRYHSILYAKLEDCINLLVSVPASITNDWLVNSEQEWMWKKLVMACPKYCLTICLEKEKKANKKPVTHISWCHGQDSNHAVPLQQIRSVDCYHLIHHHYQKKCLTHVPSLSGMSIPHKFLQFIAGTSTAYQQVHHIHTAPLYLSSPSSNLQSSTLVTCNKTLGHQSDDGPHYCSGHPT